MVINNVKLNHSYISDLTVIICDCHRDKGKWPNCDRWIGWRYGYHEVFITLHHTINRGSNHGIHCATRKRSSRSKCHSEWSWFSEVCNCCKNIQNDPPENTIPAGTRMQILELEYKYCEWIITHTKKECNNLCMCVKHRNYTMPFLLFSHFWISTEHHAMVDFVPSSWIN